MTLHTHRWRSKHTRRSLTTRRRSLPRRSIHRWWVSWEGLLLSLHLPAHGWWLHLLAHMTWLHLSAHGWWSHLSAHWRWLARLHRTTFSSWLRSEYCVILFLWWLIHVLRRWLPRRSSISWVELIWRTTWLTTGWTSCWHRCPHLWHWWCSSTTWCWDILFCIDFTRLWPLILEGLSRL